MQHSGHKNSAGVLNLLTLLYQNIRAVKRTRRIVHEEAVKHSALLPTASHLLPIASRLMPVPST